MSTGRESILLVLAANLVLTVLVVGAAMALFTPEPAASAPGAADSLRESLAAQEREVRALRERLAKLELENELQARRIEELSRAPREIEPGEAAAGAEPAGDPAGKPDAPAPEEAMQAAFHEMIQRQAKRARDRYINDLLYPTPETEARQLRQVERIADMVTQSLGLEPRDRDAVERVLTEVDARRRERFRELAKRKPSADDITYAEVEEVLSGSFAEEDRLIAEALPEEKAAEYKKTADSFRQILLLGAQAAFPKKEE